ncbi:MAG: 30S ribosomal protein S5 [Candidatus Nealsonbacteria bacterium]|nr:30S ribosomal protein S5 [Candidatus Nealsonbacteria bacterium]
MVANRRQKRQRRGKDDEFESKLLDLARVSHTREGGKKLRFRAVMVVGDKKGKVGVGVASGLDVAKAIEKASRLAKKNLIEVPMEDGTVPHPVEAKFGAAKVLIKPQSKGRGMVAGGTVRVICKLAGIEDISSKVLGGTTNKMNNAKATLKALKKLRKKEPAEKEK